MRQGTLTVVFIIALLAPRVMQAQLSLLLNRGAPGLYQVAAANYTNDTAFFYGDSITMGYLLTNPPVSRFSALLCAHYDMIENNLSVGGSEITDAGESDVITMNAAINATNVTVWLAGYNDIRYYGTNAAALTDNMAAVELLAAWLAVPTAIHVPYSNTGIAYAGSWTLQNRLGGDRYSTATGSTAKFNFSGTTLLIGTLRDVSGGNATVVVDGAITNNVSCLRTAAPSGEGRAYSGALIVFTNLANSTHTAVVTAQSTAAFYFCWYAAYVTNQLPKVVLCGTLHAPPEGLTNAPPYILGTDLAADMYTAAISNAAAVLVSAGLNVKWVPPPTLSTNTDWESDWIHPNESGHAKIETALQAGF